MLRTSARRLSLALILGATSLITAGSAYADGTTGTDPCPKGWLCNSDGSATPASTAAPVTVTGTIAKVALILLGVA